MSCILLVDLLELNNLEISYVKYHDFIKLCIIKKD